MNSNFNKIQLILTEMKSYDFAKKFSSLAQEARVLSTIKILDSLKDDPPGIVEKLKDAFEIWVENGHRSVFDDAVSELSEDQIDKIYDQILNSTELPFSSDSNIKENIFQEIVKRIDKLSIYDLLLAENVVDTFFSSSKTFNRETGQDFLNSIIEAIIDKKQKHSNTLVYNNYTWNNWIKSNSKQKYFEILVNESEELLQLIENLKGKGSEPVSNNVILNYMLTNFKLIKKSDLNLFRKIATNYIDNNVNKDQINTNFLFRTLFEKSVKSNLLKSLKNISIKDKNQIFSNIQSIFEYSIKTIEKIKNVDLTDEEKDISIKIIDLIRLVYKSDDDEKWRIHDQLNYSLVELIESITNIDPTVKNDESINIINLYVITNFNILIKSYDVIDDLVDVFRHLYEKKSELETPEFKEYFDMFIDVCKSLSTVDENKTKKIIDDYTIRSIIHNKINDLGEYSQNIIKKWIQNNIDKKDRLTFLSNFKKQALKAVNDQEKLNKKLKEKVPPEANVRSALGQYAFAEQRPKKVPFEKNTDIENSLYKSLKNHFEGNEPISKKESELLQQFLENNQYSSIIHEPTQEFVFRGMGVNNDYLRKALRIKKTEDIPKSGSVVARFTFNPIEDRGATSWTIDQKVAKKFTSAQTWKIIMVASTITNLHKFVMCPNALYTVKGLDTYDEEKEVIALGAIKVVKLFWGSDDTNLKKVLSPKKKISKDK